MNQNELLAKAHELCGLTFYQLAQHLNLQMPLDIRYAKGWLGQAIEKFLGASSGSLPQPDFPELSIELKTLPIDNHSKVTESTYVTILPLINELECNWENSVCYRKLQKILWIPIEGDKNISFNQRRIGQALLWTPDEKQYFILKQDWETIIEMVIGGQVEKINGSIGQYLHIRPKAANASVLTATLDEDANIIKTLPRGFYLRTLLTNQIISKDLQGIVI